MNLGTLVNNIVGIRRQAKEQGISLKRFGNLEIVERAGNRTVISESIKFSLCKDTDGKYYILKESYDTTQDAVARVNRGTKFL